MRALSIVLIAPLLAIAAICGARAVMGPRLTGSQALRGRFVDIRRLKGIDSPLKSDGGFVLAPGRGLVWRTENPIPTTTVITQEGIRQIMNGNEVQRIDAARAPFLSRFYDMLNGALLGDWAPMRRDFTVVTSGDSRSWQTTLTPRNSGDPIAGLIGSITLSGAKSVDRVVIERVNGDSEQMQFTDQRVIDSLSDDDARLLARSHPRQAE